MPTATEKRPITAETRFTITPTGAAALKAAVQETAPGTCPRCGSGLVVVNCYQGGRGHLPWDFCENAACDYARRSA